MSGSISREEFLALGDILISASQRIPHDWRWDWRSSAVAECGEEKYLTHEEVLLSHRILEEEAGRREDMEEGIEDDDVAALHSHDACILMEYHIVYSAPYACPVLYFRASFLDGKPLSISQVMGLLSLDGDTPGTIVTQAEHPLLGKPFFFVHPCNTTSFLKELLADEDMGRRMHKYLSLWVSLVGRMALMSVPLQFIQEITQQRSEDP
jgi:ubiquitin-like-conjugating enzyme ATG10